MANVEIAAISSVYTTVFLFVSPRPEDFPELSWRAFRGEQISPYLLAATSGGIPGANAGSGPRKSLRPATRCPGARDQESKVAKITQHTVGPGNGWSIG